MGKRILLVDDEPLMLKGLKYTLEQEGYETDLAMDGEEAHLVLTIANPLPDASGRYVRIGEDTPIYYLPPALLDPMMPIAVHGLAA